jgi:hypothetical protein
MPVSRSQAPEMVKKKIATMATPMNYSPTVDPRNRTMAPVISTP